MEKKAILALIRERILQQIEISRSEMELAQESANSEEKSSAGDKYETGRAMSQQQRDFFAKRLNESNLQLNLFESAVRLAPGGNVQSGSLIKAGKQLIFIGAGLGLISLPSGERLICTTADSPVGKNLIGKKTGEEILFAGQVLIIESIT